MVMAIACVFLLAFIAAVANEVIRTGGGTFNPLEDIQYVYNVTVNNTQSGDDIANITEVNITIPSSLTLNLAASNFSNAAARFTNTSTILSWRNASGPSGFLINGTNNTKWFGFNASAATPGVYNLSIKLLNGSGTSNFNITITVNDTTSPHEINATPSTGSNQTGLLSVNVSVLDNFLNGLGIQYVNITVINSSGGQNATYQALNLSGDYWNFTINTSQFSDGLYNITIWANDTYGNINSSVVIQRVRFDNNAPTSSISCTPNPAETGETVTCSCSPSDGNGAGINTSLTSYTVNPSTTNTGTFVQSCSFTDNVGLSGTATTSLLVEQSAGGGSSSGGSSGGSSGSSASSFYVKTVSATSKNFEELGEVKQELKIKERVKITIASSGDHYIGVREVATNSVLLEITSDPISVRLELGKSTKVDVDRDGFYDILVELDQIADGKASLTLKYIREAVPSAPVEVVEAEEAVVADESLNNSNSGNSRALWIGVIVVAIAALAITILVRKGRKYR